MFLFGKYLTPSLSQIVEMLGNPPASAIAKHLHVHERTVYMWLSTDQAPRPALLALWFETRHAKEELFYHLMGECRLVASMYTTLRNEYMQLRDNQMKILAQLEQLDQSVANQPLFKMPIDYTRMDIDFETATPYEPPPQYRKKKKRA